jgi:hypothetical protein
MNIVQQLCILTLGMALNLQIDGCASCGTGGTHASTNGGRSPGNTGGTSSTAHLIFQSDFGGSVHMANPTADNCSKNNGWWPILGEDAGFVWPITVNGGRSPGLQFISEGPNVAWDPGNGNVEDCRRKAPVWKAEIIQGTRHEGTSGPILHRINYQNMNWQFPYVLTPTSDVNDEYQEIWIKLPSDLATMLGPSGWYEFAAWKTSSTLDNGENYDYRVQVQILTDSNGTPYWQMDGAEHSGPFYWEQTSHTVVPLGHWFKFEWAWHRTRDNTSWVWVKIDGTRIMEQNGGGDTCSGCDTVRGFYNSAAPIDRIFIGPMYGNSGPTETWIDHIEIWDSVP